MNVVVSGSSGLIGSALVAAVRSEGHHVRTLVRREPRGPDEVGWDPATGELDPRSLAGVEAAVHLAGAGIGDRRWTAAYKQTLLDSRLQSTRLLATSLAQLEPRPRVLLSASAVGFYGDTRDRVVDETAAAGQGFLADVCVAWEAAAAPAREAGLRVCELRTGIVLSRHGGALARLLPIFRAGFGGRIGSGRQYQSWIALSDEIAAIRFLLEQDSLSGPVNLTAPHPVPQAEFARTLGAVLHRPALLPAPGPAVRLAIGPFADEGVLAGQRVLPAVLTAAGFRFGYPQLAEALTAELR